jgi:hypothetical protein
MCCTNVVPPVFITCMKRLGFGRSCPAHYPGGVGYVGIGAFEAAHPSTGALLDHLVPTAQADRRRRRAMANIPRRWGTLTDGRIDVRAAEPSDRTAVLGLLSASLGWSSDERFAAFSRGRTKRTRSGDHADRSRSTTEQSWVSARSCVGVSGAQR